MDAATASGNHLVVEVLDDPTVTQQDLGEMNEMWEEVCVKSVQKQERLNEAQEVCNVKPYPAMDAQMHPSPNITSKEFKWGF